MRLTRTPSYALTAACMALFAGACGARSDGAFTVAAVGSEHQAITGGTTDSGDPAVIALVDASGTEHCSGTLVAPRAILTAGHCSGVTGAAVFGATASASRRIGIASVLRHPMYAGEGHGYDVAIMHLASAVNDIAPVPVAERPLPANAVGMTVRHVGFGVTNDSTGAGRGIKRQVSYPITELDPLLYWSGAPNEQTCDGDSGGPGLVILDGKEQIVGLVSGGPACPAPGNDARVDVTDIRAWIATNAPLPSSPPADAGTTPPDAGSVDAASLDAAPPDLGSSEDGGDVSGRADGGSGGPHGGGCSAAPNSPTSTPGWLVALALVAAVRLRRPTIRIDGETYEHDV